jgi:hypothetical protein
MLQRLRSWVKDHHELVIGLMIGLQLANPVPLARATSKPLGAIVTNPAVINLVANVRVQIPGNYCSVTIFNPTNTVVYWGDLTVTTALGMPFCGVAAVCPDRTAVIDVYNGGGVWIVAGGVVAGIRYVLGTGC